MLKDLTTEQLKEAIIQCQQAIIQAYLAEKRMMEIQGELERRQKSAEVKPE